MREGGVGGVGSFKFQNLVHFNGLIVLAVKLISRRVMKPNQQAVSNLS